MLDLIVQRIIEVLQSLPSIPLWMALAAIMPVTWSPILIYFGITIILGLLDWTGLARAVRSKLLSLREEDYVLAAQLMGAKPSRIIGRHLVPGFMSHLIATATISIPGMILGETALSLPRPRPAAADHQLGHPADRGAKRQRDRLLSVAAVPDGPGDPGDPRLQLPRRRPARRGRSVQVGPETQVPGTVLPPSFGGKAQATVELARPATSRLSPCAFSATMPSRQTIILAESNRLHG